MAVTEKTDNPTVHEDVKKLKLSHIAEWIYTGTTTLCSFLAVSTEAKHDVSTSIQLFHD